MSLPPSKPLPPSDLVSDPSAIPSSPTFDCPLLDSLRKFENQLRHLELSIVQNRARGAVLQEECYRALRITQLLAFDFMFVELFIGTSSPSQLMSFVDACVLPRFNLSSTDLRGLDAFTEHVRFLHFQIRNSLAVVLKCEPRTLGPSKQLADVITLISTRTQQLQAELSQAERDQSTEEPVVVDIQLPLSEASADIDIEIDPRFANWLRQKMNLGAPVVDPETAEFRALFGTLVCRLEKVAALKSEIDELKSRTISTEHVDYVDCSPDVVYQSPFFQAVQSNCRFLDITLRTVLAQKKLVPGCLAAVGKSQKHLETLKQKCDQTLTEMDEYVQEMKAKLDQRKQAADELNREIGPYADALCCDLTNYQLEEFINLTNSLDQDIESRLKKVMASYGTDQENRYKIEGQLKHLYDLRKLRSGVVGTSQSSFDVLKTNHGMKCELFKRAVEFCKNEEMATRSRQEFEQMTLYHGHLKKLIELMNVERIQDWCGQLMEVSQVLVDAIAEQQSLQEKLEPLLDDEFGNVEIEQIEREVEELIVANSQLVEAEAVLNCEIADAEEELFRVTQEIMAYRGEDDELDDITICPVCNVNVRNCFLMTCGHPICRKCMEEAKVTYECPICQMAFQDSDAKPFILD